MSEQSSASEMLEEHNRLLSEVARFVGRHPEPGDLDALEQLSKAKFIAESLVETLRAIRLALDDNDLLDAYALIGGEK